jgi:hypothetical protein
MRTIIRKLFSGKDNNTPDLGRVLWAISLVSFISLTFYSLATGHYTFDPVTWGAGCAALLASGGAALYAKASTEPFEIKTAAVSFKRGKHLSRDDEEENGASTSDTTVVAVSEESGK